MNAPITGWGHNEGPLTRVFLFVKLDGLCPHPGMVYPQGENHAIHA